MCSKNSKISGIIQNPFHGIPVINFLFFPLKKIRDHFQHGHPCVPKIPKLVVSYMCVLKKDLKELIEVDKFLIKEIIGSHSKVLVEFLYLETSTLSIDYIVAKRRLMYLKNILRRPKHELVRKIYSTQKQSPVPGDWVIQVKEDLNLSINLNISDETIETMKDMEYKKLINSHIEAADFKSLKEVQATHNKIKDIKYETFERQA